MCSAKKPGYGRWAPASWCQLAFTTTVDPADANPSKENRSLGRKSCNPDAVSVLQHWFAWVPAPGYERPTSLGRGHGRESYVDLKPRGHRGTASAEGDFSLFLHLGHRVSQLFSPSPSNLHHPAHPGPGAKKRWGHSWAGDAAPKASACPQWVGLGLQGRGAESGTWRATWWVRLPEVPGSCSRGRR